MLHRILTIFVIFLTISSVSWAGGRKEANEKRTAEDPSGFTDSVDITKKKQGKYNYYLEAKDKAGNIVLSGPENIFLDPASDLPQATIINPVPNMRVQGNLNLVGIAFDDDGVSKVELVVTRGRDGKGEELVRVAANGKDYWSYFLDTTNNEIWVDGVYTVTAWATDINELSGIASEYLNGEKVNPKSHKKSVVTWQLDRRKPVTIVKSHEVGALVSGNIGLRGTVADGNGISFFSYSVDDGNSYIPIKPSLNGKTGEYDWSISINTKQFEDGPAVILFQAFDGHGSIGNAAHLLFANNTGPEIKVVYPEEGATVNGVFSLAGFVKHPIGVNKITWKAGTASGEIDILPGNNWWSAEGIDIRNQKISSVDIEVRAEDVSGNVTVYKQKFKVDPVADLPTLSLTDPSPGVLDNQVGLVVRGLATDDDGVAFVNYTLNGASFDPIPCNGHFQFVIPTPPTGTHNLEVWATDINGVAGLKTPVKGIIVPPAPIVPSITSFTIGKLVRNFDSGMMLTPVEILNGKGAAIGMEKITMQVAFKAAVLPDSPVLIINDGTPHPLKLTSAKDNFTAIVPFDNPPEGKIKLELKATDKQGREASHVEFIFFSNQVARNEQWFNPATEVFEQRLVPAAVPFDFEMVLGGDKNPRLLTDGRILLHAEDQILTGVSSLPIRNISVTGNNNITVEQDRSPYQVKLRANQEGDLGQFSLRLEMENGSTQTRGPFRLLAGMSAPVINVPAMASNWVRGSAPVRFTVTGRTRVTNVEYSTDMGAAWVSFGAIAADYNRNIDVSAINDGSICILIRATNEAGKTAIQGITFLKDNTAPVTTLAMPIADEKVNGTIRIAFAINESSVLNTVTYNRPARAGSAAISREVFNASSWDKDYQRRFVEVTLDSQTPLDQAMSFTFTDAVGNSSTFNSWPFIIDQQTDIPVVLISLPEENEVITTDSIASGVMYDDDGIKNIQWRLNNGQWQTIEAKNGFSVPLYIKDLTDNVHTLTVVAEDIYGVRSAPVVRPFRVSLAEPANTIAYPLTDTVLKEGVEVRGSAFDRNGIKQVRVSVDNGNTYNTVAGNFGGNAETVPWTYTFNTLILKDGAHVVFIQVLDNYDIPATYATMINVDNTIPDIAIESPEDGSRSTGKLSVMGRVIDPNLKEVTIQLRGLDGQAVSNNLRSRTLAPNMLVREAFDLTGQADGFYNIAIVGTDRAGNVTRISRNFELARQTFKNFLEILYPLENETVSGEFNLYGYAGGADKAGTVFIRVNGTDITSDEVDEDGYFSFNLTSADLKEGNNQIVVYSNFGGSTRVNSRNYNIAYKASGPWVAIDSFTFGNFAYERPYLYGRTGYILSEDDKAIIADKNASKEKKTAIQSKVLDFTEISFDNGRTFEKLAGKKTKTYDYRYRLETGEMTEGVHYIVVRSTMKNKETAITRMLVQVDKTPPVIKLISPEMGGRYNNEIIYSASAFDDIELVSLDYHLRKGDKNLYGVPGFLQGLYLEAFIPPFIRQLLVKGEKINKDKDWTRFLAGGATYMDVGLGLSFFDDNVKVQFSYGFLKQNHYESLGGTGQVRYGGDVIGIKMLANLYRLPFGSFAGPDWEWLSMTFAVGANFSYFNVGNKLNISETERQGKDVYYTQSGKPTWMSALLLQIEFPRVTIAKAKYLRTFSIFWEGQLWFVPTDVDAKANDLPVVLPKIVVGFRLYIF